MLRRDVMYPYRRDQLFVVIDTEDIGMRDEIDFIQEMARPDRQHVLGFVGLVTQARHILEILVSLNASILDMVECREQFFGKCFV
ncbi:hypothetical protein D3C87_1686430 [compost metagenome]